MNAESGDGATLGDEWDGEPGERVPDDDEVLVSVGERLDDSAGVLRRAGGGVLARQVDAQPAVAAEFELVDQRFPTPGAVIGAVHESEGGRGGGQPLA